MSPAPHISTEELQFVCWGRKVGLNIGTVVLLRPGLDVAGIEPKLEVWDSPFGCGFRRKSTHLSYGGKTIEFVDTVNYWQTELLEKLKPFADRAQRRHDDERHRRIMRELKAEKHGST